MRDSRFKFQDSGCGFEWRVEHLISRIPYPASRIPHPTLRSQLRPLIVDLLSLRRMHRELSWRYAAGGDDAHIFFVRRSRRFRASVSSSERAKHIDSRGQRTSLLVSNNDL